MQSASQNKHVAQLRTVHKSVLSKIEKLSNLNEQYRHNQEKQFFKTFLHVMDRMSTQLCKAEEQYANIDRQIQKDQKCVQLSTKLSFFKDECLALRLELDKTELELKNQKQKQKQILKQNSLLQNNLFRKSKQLLRYKSKAQSLSKNQVYEFQRNQTNNSQVFIDTQSISSPTKKHSLSQTKNTKTTSFDKNQSLVETPSNAGATQNQFRIKAAKMAKQRKLMMNRTNFTNADKDTGSNRKRNKLSQLLKI